MSWKNRIVSYSVTSSGLTPETGPQKVVDAFRIRFPRFLIDVWLLLCCSCGQLTWLPVRSKRVTSRLPTDKYRSYIHRLTFTDWDFYRFGLLMSLVGQVTFCAIKLKSISFENWKICPFAAVWLICRKYFKISLQYKCSLKMSNFSQIYTKRTVWWQSLTTSVSENAYIFQILRLDWCLWK